MAANIKRIKETKLCRGDLRHYVDIQTRALVSSDFGSAQPVEEFTTIRRQWCAIETISGVFQGVSRFAKINILDGTTHVFWCLWDADFPDLENRNHFLSCNSKRYKVLRFDNVNERNWAIAIQVTERGDIEKGAAQA